MFIIFVLLWIIAVLLIYANPKEPWAWWGSACLFLNGFGGVAVIFTDNIIPLANQTQYEKLITLCLICKGIANMLQHYLATYAFIVFVLLFTNFLNIKLKKNAKVGIIIALVIPSILMFTIYPIDPAFEPNYKVLSSWICGYTLAAIIILIISIFKEKDDSIKEQKILAAVFVIPSVLSIMWTSYLSVAVGHDDFWYNNLWIILFQFVLFIFLTLRYGLLGIRLKIERSSLDNTIDTMINGMSIVSHAVKNEASTINLCVDTIRCLEQVSPNTDKKLSIIKESCKSLSDFTYKISKFKIYEVKLEPYVLSTLYDKIINQVMPSTFGKTITITNKSKIDITILIDVIHISEVLKNLLINAIEAIELEGLIDIDTEVINNKLMITVIDNGIGISQESINKVMTPFYSTKKGKNNFGLGLSYCYKVMKSHNGSLQIKSKENQGTAISLLFPLERVLNISNRVCSEIK